MVVMSEIIGKDKIKKTIIKQGAGEKPTCENGSKATFHFRTLDPATDKVNLFYFMTSIGQFALSYVQRLEQLCPTCRQVWFS